MTVRTLSRQALFGFCALATVSSALAASAPSASGAPSAGAQEYATAAKTMSDAKSFHVNATLTGSSQRTVLNLSLSPKLGGGTISEGGAKFQVVVSGPSFYMKGTKSSWQAEGWPATVAATVANRWVKVPPSDTQLAQWAELTQPKDFVATVLEDPAPTDLTSAGTASVDGRTADVLLSDSGIKVYIAALGAPYILELQATTATRPELLSFIDFGKAPMPSVPKTSVPLPPS